MRVRTPAALALAGDRPGSPGEGEGLASEDGGFACGGEGGRGGEALLVLGVPEELLAGRRQGVMILALPGVW